MKLSRPSLLLPALLLATLIPSPAYATVSSPEIPQCVYERPTPDELALCLANEPAYQSEVTGELATPIEIAIPAIKALRDPREGLVSIPCEFRLRISAGYKKLSFSILNDQFGTSEGTTTCPGSNTLTTSMLVFDAGLPPDPIQTQQANSGTNYSFVQAQQTVAILSTRGYRSFGNLIRWTGRLTIRPDANVTIQGPNRLCIGASAIFGFDPTVDGSGC